MRRRPFLLLPLAALLAGCGYHTIVPQQRVAGAGPPIHLLVAARDERRAQQLRDDLELALGSAGVAPDIVGVSVRLEIVTQQLAVRRDETPSRARLSATVRYVATPRAAEGAAEPAPLRGTVYVTEGYNFVDTQFFTTDSSGDAAERRLMQQAAAEIARRLMAVTAARR